MGLGDGASAARDLLGASDVLDARLDDRPSRLLLHAGHGDGAVVGLGDGALAHLGPHLGLGDDLLLHAGGRHLHLLRLHDRLGLREELRLRLRDDLRHDLGSDHLLGARLHLGAGDGDGARRQLLRLRLHLSLRLRDGAHDGARRQRFCARHRLRDVLDLRARLVGQLLANDARLGGDLRHGARLLHDLGGVARRHDHPRHGL